MNPVKLKDVARQLGLSTSTVSRALQDSADVSAGTRQRVQQLAAALRYQPNSHARSLRTQRSGTLAVVVPATDHYFTSQAIRGIEAVARPQGYQVLLCATHHCPAREAEALHFLTGGLADGILLAPVGDGPPSDPALGCRPPLVVFGRVARAAHQASITADEYVGSYCATAHLLQAGCRRVLLLVPAGQPAASCRVQGYADALHAQGLAFDNRLVVKGADTPAGLAQLTAQLRERPAVDGLFAAGNQLALAGYQACRAAGCRIPHDVQVIGFASPEVAGLLSPALTTVRPPAYDIGREAAWLLLQAIGGGAPMTAAHSRALPPELIIRASTRPPLAA